MGADSESERGEIRIRNLINQSERSARWRKVVNEHLPCLPLNYATTALIFKLNENYMPYITMPVPPPVLCALEIRAPGTLSEYVIELAKLRLGLIDSLPAPRG